MLMLNVHYEGIGLVIEHVKESIGASIGGRAIGTRKGAEHTIK